MSDRVQRAGGRPFTAFWSNGWIYRIDDDMGGWGPDRSQGPNPRPRFGKDIKVKAKLSTGNYHVRGLLTFCERLRDVADTTLHKVGFERRKK